MPYTINWKSQGVILHFFEEVTKTDALDSIGDLVGNSMFDTCKYRIIDFTKVTKITYTYADLKMIVSFAKQAERWNRNSITIIINSKQQFDDHVKLYITQRKSMGTNIEHAFSIKEAEDRIETHLAQTKCSPNHFSH